MEKNIRKLSLFASWPGTMINPHWLELPMSQTVFYGPKVVRAIEVRLYFGNFIGIWPQLNQAYQGIGNYT